MQLYTLGALIALLAGAAHAQPVNEHPPGTTAQCIEVGGRSMPAVCDAPAGRLQARENICTCPNGGTRVDVAVCNKGERPPPEGRALNVARRAAIRDGSLVGDTFEGRPICAAPRRPNG